MNDETIIPAADNTKLESVATDIFLAIKHDGLSAEDAAVKLQGYEVEEVAVIEQIIEDLLNDHQKTDKSESTAENTSETAGEEGSKQTEACDPVSDAPEATESNVSEENNQA